MGVGWYQAHESNRSFADVVVGVEAAVRSVEDEAFAEEGCRNRVTPRTSKHECTRAQQTAPDEAKPLHRDEQERNRQTAYAETLRNAVGHETLEMCAAITSGEHSSHGPERVFMTGENEDFGYLF